MRWIQTVPNDRYIIQVKRPISSAELGYLVHLYQPLLGVLPIALYQTLYHHVSLANFSSTAGLHRGLMVSMGTSLDVIIKARHKLEAMGLLDTYRLEVAGEYILEYLLSPPYSPDLFFNDDTLSIMLLNRVGKQHYRGLRRRFSTSVEKPPASATRERITKGFDEVFYHLSPSEITLEPGTETDSFFREVEKENMLDAFQEEARADRTYQSTTVDFALLEALLPKSLKKEDLFTPIVCETLQELAFLYQFTDLQLAYFLQDETIYLADHSIDVAVLRRNAKEWFRHMNGGQAPRIYAVDEIPEFKPEAEGASKVKPVRTREEEHNRMLASLSPLQLLSYYHNGARVAPSDQKIVEELLEEYKLPYGVVNVLLEYIMLTQEKQLPKALIYKIAAHWKRMDIRTVEEAQKLAKQLYSEHKGSAGQTGRGKAEGGKTPARSRSSQHKTARKDDIPPLIRDQLARQKEMERHSSAASAQESADEEYEKTKESIHELLKAMGEIK
ncbi:replication initiation and membrane attachment family protein [Aneurinibacillus terranovensis]|uniref:replication initiation and membrane attachment family protein n=1 Tax=Aneurinibacillus terranovensis TaxID=278991 RepID=UPI00042791AD|nr:DnaD domain protein [Aneurinibacillus terranovensis]